MVHRLNFESFGNKENDMISIGDFVQYHYREPVTNTVVSGVGTVVNEIIIGTDNGFAVQRPDGVVVHARNANLLYKKQ